MGGGQYSLRIRQSYVQCPSHIHVYKNQPVDTTRRVCYARQLVAHVICMDLSLSLTPGCVRPLAAMSMAAACGATWNMSTSIPWSPYRGSTIYFSVFM